MTVERRSVDVMGRRKLSYEGKIVAFQEFNTKLLSFETAAQTLQKTDTFNVFTSSLASSNAAVDAENVLSVTTSSSASPGTMAVEVKNLAEAQKVSSSSFSDTTTSLNSLTTFNGGYILVNGREVFLEATDSLTDVRDKINAVNSGSSPSNVTASILSVSSTDKRLILTSEATGADGMSLLEAANDSVLQELGIHAATTSIKNSFTGGADSDTLSSSVTAVGTLLDLSDSQAGTVTINGVGIAINLGTDSLTAIATTINNSALGAGTASVESVTEDGSTRYYLRINETSYTDVNNILETLGVLDGDFATVTTQVLTGSQSNKLAADPSQNVVATTKFNQIFNANVTANDTILISGTDHNGNQVSGSYTITNPSANTIQNLLDAIRTTFNSTVTASVSSGKIVLTDSTAGDSQLALTLTANNQGGGALNFGTFAVTTTGSDRELVAGRDATIVLDGLEMTRSSNSISDVAAGVTLNLKAAASGTTINVSIGHDSDAMIEDIEAFVDAYNDVFSFINEQNTFDEETQQGGALFGDSTLLGVRRTLTTIIGRTVSGVAGDYNSLSRVGITSDRDGILSINSSTLRSVIESNFNDVLKLFTAQGTTTDANIDFVSNTKQTKSGTYAINITQLAAKAAVTGTVNLLTNPISAGGETVTITDFASGGAATVTLSAGDTIDTIVSAINGELSVEQTETEVGSVRNTTDGSTAITNSTTFAGINGAGITPATSGTITFEGTDRLGGEVSGSYSYSNSSTDTVQLLLTAIETAYGNTVHAFLDNGYLVLQDARSGNSQMSLSFTSLPGSLDFGTLSTANSSTNFTGEEGRYAIEITATKNGSNQLVLTHDLYGSANGFSVSSGANKTGTNTATLQGTDVAGTINGEAATGKGQMLTGDAGTSTSIAGLALLVKGSTTGSRGTVTLTLGVGEQMASALDYITLTNTGTVPSRILSLETTTDDIAEQIENMEARLTKRRQLLLNRFVALEVTIAKLNAQSSFLSQRLLG
ncbi:MAG: flagellar filament capping protein FliD [Candidatus Tectomicrobia bacterium]|nr:flagellar filament capping protein FliD [Candidatus Tectomicrobia bacterium]